MENFHVYRDGKYDRKANIKIKAKAAAEKALADLDTWFLSLYDVK